MKCIKLFATLFGLMLTAFVPAQAQLIKVGGSATYIKGANLPWLDGHYSYYLGLDPRNPTWGCAFNYASMEQHMSDMHNMGINVVRLWLNQGDQGCTLDGNGRVTGVTSLYWTNLDNTVYLAGKYGIHLYLTLNGGRSDFLTDGAMLNAYINNVLKPMINRYKGDTRVFAIDAMNEIDGAVGGPDGNYGSGPSWAQAQAYMRAIVSAVHSVDSSRLVSCSTGWHSWNNLGYFKGQGLDFYDFHLYNDNGYIPPASSLGLDKPVLIGEAGQSTNAWNDGIQNTMMANILANSRNGYAGVAAWAYQFAGCTDKFTLINANGSWRPICNTIKNFVYSNTGTGGGGGTTSGTLVANGTYTVVSKNSGMAIDVPGGSTADGTQLAQWWVNGGNNQKWKLTNVGNNVVTLVNLNSGKAIDVPGGSQNPSTVIQQWDVNGGKNQQWTVVSAGSGYYKLVNVNSNQALDVTGASTTAGALINQYYTSGSANQLWKFQ